MRIYAENNSNYIKSSDTGSTIRLKVIENYNSPVDLTTFEKVEIAIGNESGLILNLTPAFIDKNGYVEFTMNQNSLPKGKYFLEVHLTKTEDKLFIAPSQGNFILTISKSLNELGQQVPLINVQVVLNKVDEALTVAKASVTDAKTAKTQSETALTQSTQAITMANSTINIANEAKTIATETKNQADQALIAANSTIENANQAILKVEIAEANSSEALELATQASLDSTDAKTKAIQANTDSSNALTKATQAIDKATQAETKSDQALITANSTISKSDTAISDSAIAKTKSENAEALATQANTNSSTALSNSEHAVSTAEEALAIIEQADENSANAVTKANTAFTTSNEALTTANVALTTANSTIEKSDEALLNSTDATTKANEALIKANTSIIDSSDAKIKATNAEQVANLVRSEFDQIASGNTDAEVIGARTDSNNVTYNTIKERLDNIDSNLENKTTQAVNTSKTYTDSKISDLVNSAPEALDTLGELAIAIQNHEDAYDSLLTVIGEKATKTDLDNKVDKVSGKQLSTNDYTTTEKNKLANIEPEANKYVHPSSHPPTIIDQNSNNRFVTDTEKLSWNSKYNKPSSGIPKTDLDSTILSSLSKADNAIQNIEKGVANGVARLNSDGKVVDANGNEVEGKVTSVNGQIGDVTLEVSGDGIIEQDTPPTGIVEGRLWLDTSDSSFQETIFEELEQKIQNPVRTINNTITPDSSGNISIPSLNNAILRDNLDKGRLMTTFNNFALWYGAVTQDATHTLIGNTSLKITTDSTNTTAAGRLRSASYDFSKTKRMMVRLYIEDINKFSNFEIRFSSVDNMATYLSYKTTKWRLIQGWNEIMIPLSKLTVTGNESITNKITTIQVSMTGDPGTSIWLDSIYLDRKGKGKVLFHFDDGFSSQYTKAFKILNYRGMVGSIGLISDFVGTNGYMTLAQAKEMYTYGWDIFNHTKTHPDLSTITKEQVKIELDSCRNFLINNGLIGAHDLVAYPYGGFNNDVLDVMKDYRMGRTTREEYELSPSIQQNKLKVVNLFNTTEVSAAKAHIDNIVETGSTVIFLLHKIEDTGTEETIYHTSKFQEIVDYIYSKSDSLEVLTWSEYAELQ